MIRKRTDLIFFLVDLGVIKVRRHCTYRVVVPDSWIEVEIGGKFDDYIEIIKNNR